MRSPARKSDANRLTNYMEELTGSILERMLSDEKRLHLSPPARRDVKALALNRLWPMYVTTDSGRDFLKKIVVEDKIENDIVRELRAAIDIVKSNPRR